MERFNCVPELKKSSLLLSLLDPTTAASTRKRWAYKLMDIAGHSTVTNNGKVP